MARRKSQPRSGSRNGSSTIQGELLPFAREVVDVPVSRATACTFGGADLDQLFITTSRENLPPETEPAAGSLFVATPGVRGRPVREFAG